MNGPNQGWTGAFTNVSGQGAIFDDPMSEGGQYYAFLSKVDLDAVANTYDLLFEVVPKLWLENAIATTTVDLPMEAPTSPASLFHIVAADPTTVLNVLGVKSPDLVAEGSWYLLTLTQDPAQGQLPGDLYDPDIDLQKTST